MIMEKASYKVEDGKMLKLKLEKENTVIKSAELRGDFFLEPAEKLSEIEQALTGISEKASVKDVADRVRNVDVKMIGFNPEDLGKAFEKALGDNRE
ncbi:Lipoate--protein ligase [Candidatus Nanohalovita haloferacivicina]|nr:Lipoate--protein ligase [Candidatus Nanohalobia archaeon BNXNv]